MHKIEQVLAILPTLYFHAVPLHQKGFINVKLDISWHMSITFQTSRLHWPSGMAETKLAILAFLCCEESVKTPIVSVQHVVCIDRALIQASQKPLLSSFFQK